MVFAIYEKQGVSSLGRFFKCGPNFSPKVTCGQNGQLPKNILNG